MECERVELLLNAYVDGELDLVNAADLEAHVAGCASCARRRDALLALRAAAGDRALYHHAPAGLEKRIRASLKDAGQPAQRRRWAFPRLRVSVPAGLLAAAALFLFGFLARGLIPGGLPSTGAASITAQDVQSAHVRSLMTGRLMDVASTDQHTVKPWFDGRLPFSPPVTDLAAQGYPLAGGRLDYLGDQPVAVLVYHRSKHVINLFIWPVHAGDAPTSASSDRGYNLVHWQHAGMVYWAASDLNLAELQEFARLFQQNTG